MLEEPSPPERSTAAEPPDDIEPGFERRFWLHAGVLVLVLVASLAVVGVRGLIIPDEGLYAAQAHSLSNGSWRSDLAAPDIDPEGNFDALLSEHISDGQRIPYARHPLYPVLLFVFYRVGGFTGVLVSSLLGTWVAAVAGARLAKRLGTRLVLPTLWTIGIASPLLFYSQVAVAHSLAAACLGVLLLASVKAIEDWGVRPVVSAVVAAMALVLLRSEGLVASAAVGAALGMTAWRVRPAIGLSARHVILGSTILAATALAFLVEPKVTGLIIDGTATAHATAERTTGVGSAAWASLFRPWFGSATRATPAPVLAAACFPMAALALRANRGRPLLALGLLTLGTGGALWRHLDDPDLITGLFAAFPLLLTGLLLTPLSALRHDAGKLMAIVLAISTPVLLVTMYADGGATQWGGRFFAVLLPAATPLAIAGLAQAIPWLSGKQRVFAGCALAVTSLAMSALSIRTAAFIKDVYARSVDETMAVSAALEPDGRPLIAVTQLRGNGASRMFWREVSEGAQIISLRGMGPLPEVIRSAAAADLPGMLLLTNREDVTRIVMADPLAEVGWTVTEVKSIDRSPWTLMTLESRPASAEAGSEL